MRKKILEKKGPISMEEAGLYEQVMEKEKNRRPICAWGNYLLLQYYKSNYGESEALLSKSIEFGEGIKREFKEYSFYEDALFMLGNIYFFEVFDFKMARSIYQDLINERKNTRWKSICNDRIELIANSVFEGEALKLYVFAEKYFEESKFDDAKFYLNEVVKRFPDGEIAAAASYFLGDINYYKYNDLDKALLHYRMTEEKFPKHQLAHTSLYKVGEILRRLKQWEEAIKIYRDYVKKFKSSPYKDDAYYYIGECYHNMGKLREAKNAFNLILGDYPNSKWTDVIYHKVQDINKIMREI
ncbi:MAG: tetratricopeptide repeat protein [Elusimicrobiota bacterium]